MFIGPGRVHLQKVIQDGFQLKLIKEGQKCSKKLGPGDYFADLIGDCNTEYA